jgi:hypothetical protein
VGRDSRKEGGGDMGPAKISHYLLNAKALRNRDLKISFESILAGLLGCIFGLLMGMTAIALFLDKQAVMQAGEPGMLLIKVIVVGTFVILSVILFTKGSEGEGGNKDSGRNADPEIRGNDDETGSDGTLPV